MIVFPAYTLSNESGVTMTRRRSRSPSALLGQMDIAGGIFASKIAKGRCATIGVDAMTFRKPVYVGDVMCVYASLIRIGTTSITVGVEAWVIRRNQTNRILVTEGNFTYVAVDDNGRPRKVEA